MTNLPARQAGISPSSALWIARGFRVVITLWATCSVSDANGQRLPWEDTEPDFGTVARPTTSREMLAVFGIDQEQLDAFVDGVPIAENEVAVLQRLLFRLPRISAGNRRNWTRRDWNPAVLAQSIERYRGECFRVRGRVRRVDVETVPEGTALRLEFDRYYRVLMRLDGTPATAIIYSRRVPRAWTREARLDEPAVADAILVKRSSPTEPVELIFAAARVAWFPNRADAELDVPTDHTVLARLGMDIGLFDDARELNRKALTAGDSESFYELLAAVGRAPEGMLQSHASTPLELAGVMSRPELEHGRITMIRGTIRRITRILVEDSDIRTRLGIKDYFQLDIFVPLGNQVIMFGRDGSRPKPTFSGRYPVTVCTLTLPRGLAEGERVDQDVIITAAFFKLWAYRSRYVSSVDDVQLQLSPMFVGAEPAVLHRKRDGRLSLLLGAGLILMLSSICFIQWRAGQADRRFADRIRRGRGVSDVTISPPDQSFPT